MQAKQKIDILTLVRHLEDQRSIADEHKGDSEQGGISDLITDFLESVGDSNFGLCFCAGCNCLTDELANDDEQLCKECVIDG